MINIRKKGILLILSVLFLAISFKTYATHIRAGEIVATRVSTTSLTYKFSIIGYTDTGSTVIFGGGDIDFGDGTVINIEEGSEFFIREELVDAEKLIAFNVFEIEHTFQAPGAYVIRFNEKNRNAGILNMSNSVDTPFYVETRILIDPFLGSNNTPIFLVPPVDEGAVGVQFIHNAGAFDLDGDSLSYKLVVPKQFKDREVDEYVDPNDPKFYPNYAQGNEDQNAPPKFEIDPITGDLVWDSPGTMGEYNVAFIVEEWRLVLGQWFNLGYVTRDMQIIIEETDNARPEIIIPGPLCVEAGTFISEIVIGVDQDGHQVRLEAFGGPFEFTTDPAKFTPIPSGADFANQPRQGLFEWQTDCQHVRKRSYDVQFKVTDNPPLGPKLVDFATLPITVYAPPPQGLTVDIETGRSIRLNWDKYSCGTADKMQIWRRVDNYNFNPDGCNLGIPENSGYELIATVDSIKYVDANQNVFYNNTFLDDNNGEGLAPGANYCYRIVAIFPEPAGGESVVSDEVCNIILADAPVTVNVDVTRTDRTNGEILVRWLEPFEINPVQFPPPYKYRVFRSEGFNGNQNEVEVAFIDDFEVVDKGLNTVDLVYNYRVDLYNNNGTSFVDSSSPASSVRLELEPGLNSIQLFWEAQVPWSISVQDFPMHDIYRDRVDPDNPDILMLIGQAEVTEGGLKFFDDGDFNGVPLDENFDYCYYVETKGSYGNPQIAEPLLNKSQVVCAEPNDMDPPCTPISFSINEGKVCEELVMDRGCFVNDFSNLLSWELDFSAECEDDIDHFEIFYSVDGVEPFELVGTKSTSGGNEFEHAGLNSFKGYYYIISRDRSDNPSTPSDTISFDNCPNFKLPNVFTPNKDTHNDVFSPLIDNVQGNRIPNFDLSQCPRFVEAVDFRVFDRNGGLVFAFDSGEGAEGNLNGVLINWDGKTNTGIELPSGVYYYTAEVTFDVLDQSNANQIFNGWVQLLR
ncbi:MAG: gliding motility-associated C-terminal domain-containing protein [Cyclobacteriaceae bacterium]